MSVIIGSARADEFGGEGYGAKPGDQLQKNTPDYAGECSMQEWYLHPQGWVVIRAKRADVRECLAQDMEYIVNNPHIGYSQPKDQTLYIASKPYGFDASKVTTDCDTDCARAERVCICYAGVKLDIPVLIGCPDFYTGTEISVLGNLGEFDILRDDKYCKSSDYLLRGDILCTPSKGHTVTVLTDGPKVGGAVVYKATGNVYIREGAGTEYPTLGVIPKGGLFYSKSVTENGWAQGEYEGIHGYASLKYLTPAEVKEPMLAVATGNVWERVTAGILGKAIQVIPKGAMVKLTGKTKNVLLTKWYEVNYNGKVGWASSKLLKA